MPIRFSSKAGLKRLLFISIATFLYLRLPIPCRAAILNSSDQALAAMMGTVENDFVFLGLEYGSFAETQMFTSAFNQNAFQYFAMPGSTYGGVLLNLTVSGTETAPDAWRTTTAGAVGGNRFSGNGMGTFSGNSIPESFIDSGSEREWTWFKSVTWSVDPFDPGLLHSSAQITFIRTNPKTGQLETKVVRETDERRRFADLDGTWRVSLDGIFGPEGAPVNIRGVFGADGSGSFTAAVIPEPRTLALALAAVGLLLCRKVRFKPAEH